MRFAAPEPGLIDQSSWEARLGALGRCAEDRGWQDGDACYSSAGSSSVMVVGRGAPGLGGPAWAALRAGWSQETETNPFPPCCVRSKRESKAAENHGFPFLYGEGMRETPGRRWTSCEGAAPPFPTAQGSTSAPTALALWAPGPAHPSPVIWGSAQGSPASHSRAQGPSKTSNNPRFPGAPDC